MKVSNQFFLNLNFDLGLPFFNYSQNLRFFDVYRSQYDYDNFPDLIKE